MQLVKAKSCRTLFFKCIIGAILVNVLFYVFNVFCVFNTDNYNPVIVSGFLQLCVGLILGKYICKNNRNLLLEEKQERRSYTIVTIVGVLVFLVIFLCPDIIMMPYVYVTGIIYNILGLDHLFSIFDFGCVLVCLGSVFLRKVYVTV